MDELPYEILFTIALRIDSPKDLCAFSRVSSLFLNVARDDRLWRRFCYQLYNVKPSLDDVKQSFYHLFTKILVPYGRYLGYWKSSEQYLGGLVDVQLNLSDESIVGEKIVPLNAARDGDQLSFDSDDDDDGEDEETDESSLKPVYTRQKLFTIDTQSRQIFCHQCDTIHEELPWIKTFDSSEQYFGLSQEALPVKDRSSLILHDHELQENPDERDVYFIRRCGEQSTIYHPLTIARPTTAENDHPLSRLNGLWVGSYGGHGLELLHLEYFREFACPSTAEVEFTDGIVFSDTIVARKVSGDRNVPHGKISFAALQATEVESGSPLCYDGIGQIAQTNYRSPQYIHVKMILFSDDMIKVTWYALHHTSSFKRCPF